MFLMSEVPLYREPCSTAESSESFRGGLVFKAHRLVYHSTLGWRVIKKKEVALPGALQHGGIVRVGRRVTAILPPCLERAGHHYHTGTGTLVVSLTWQGGHV